MHVFDLALPTPDYDNLLHFLVSFFYYFVVSTLAVINIYFVATSMSRKKKKTH